MTPCMWFWGHTQSMKDLSPSVALEALISDISFYAKDSPRNPASWLHPPRRAGPHTQTGPSSGPQDVLGAGSEDGLSGSRGGRSMGTLILAVNEMTSFPCAGTMDIGDSGVRRSGCCHLLCLTRHSAAAWPSLLRCRKHLLHWKT